MTRTKAFVVAIVLLLMLNIGTVIAVVRDVIAIQDQRTQACLDQNSRHDGALRELDHLIMVTEGNGTSAAVARAEAARTSTALLINALQPHRDCAHINDPPHRK